MSVLVFGVEAVQVSVARLWLSNRAHIITLHPLRRLVSGLMKQIYGCVCRGSVLVPLKPCDPTKRMGIQDCPHADFHPSIPPFTCIFLLLLPPFFLLAARLPGLHKEEAVRFPWSPCQLFPISPAPWKSLQAPLSVCLGLSLVLGYMCSRLGLPLEKLFGSPLCRPGSSLHLN